MSLLQGLLKNLARIVSKPKFVKVFHVQKPFTEYEVPLSKYAPTGTTTEDYKNFVDELLEVLK